MCFAPISSVASIAPNPITERQGNEVPAGLVFWFGFITHGIVNNTLAQPFSLTSTAFILGILSNPRPSKIDFPGIPGGGRCG